MDVVVHTTRSPSRPPRAIGEARHPSEDSLGGVGDPQRPPKWRMVQENHKKKKKENPRGKGPTTPGKKKKKPAV